MVGYPTNVAFWRLATCLESLGNHRVAWMANGVVIDSSARKALLLKENEMESAHGTNWRIRTSNRACVLQGKYLAAMRRCHVQLMDKRKNFTFFSMYRKVEAGELRFNGALVWQVRRGSNIVSVSQRKVSTGGFNSASNRPPHHRDICDIHALPTTFLLEFWCRMSNRTRSMRCSSLSSFTQRRDSKIVQGVSHTTQGHGE
jgi:hypothetical protein